MDPAVLTPWLLVTNAEAQSRDVPEVHLCEAMASTFWHVCRHNGSPHATDPDHAYLASQYTGHFVNKASYRPTITRIDRNHVSDRTVAPFVRLGAFWRGVVRFGGFSSTDRGVPALGVGSSTRVH